MVHPLPTVTCNATLYPAIYATCTLHPANATLYPAIDATHYPAIDATLYLLWHNACALYAISPTVTCNVNLPLPTVRVTGDCLLAVIGIQPYMLSLAKLP